MKEIQSTSVGCIYHSGLTDGLSRMTTARAHMDALAQCVPRRSTDSGGGGRVEGDHVSPGRGGRRSLGHDATQVSDAQRLIGSVWCRSPCVQNARLATLMRPLTSSPNIEPTGEYQPHCILNNLLLMPQATTTSICSGDGDQGEFARQGQDLMS